VDAGIYRTSSTPILVWVSFSPRLGIAQILPFRAICTFPRGGAITTSPLRGLSGRWPAGSLWAWFVVGLRFHRLSEA